MPAVLDRIRKSKVTLSLSSDVVHQLDALAPSPHAKSRSRLVEEAVREWLRKKAKEDLERETEEYYRSLTSEERRADSRWTRLAARSARRFWGE